MDCSVALTLEPLLRPSLRPWPYRSPKVGRLRQRGERFLIEHHIAEQAVLEVVFEIGRELGIADDEIARRIEPPRAIDHAVGRIIELVWHDESSEERRGGKECVRTFMIRWSPYV